MMRRFPTHSKATALAGLALFGLSATLLHASLDAPTAEACGCLSPPAPSLDDEEFAVNQQAEQIIFEVEEGFITAHVLIRYAGHPEQFAWIVPVPAVPELSLSPAAGFGLLDKATAPLIDLSATDECPVSAWECTYADMPTCESPDQPVGAQDASAGTGNDSASPVDVLDRQVVGSYETITFSAGDADAAVAWLQSEGFIVNSTMAPYMQPYADAGMLFLASKLIAGAEVSAIKPLRMRFAANDPMIPLQLTAVAADPHMTITAYIYGDALFRPEGHELVTIDEADIAVDSAGRSNYPMVLARSIDEAGGDGFVVEYAGTPVVIDFDQGTGCCNSGFDLCGIEFDGFCSCPGNEYDAVDCAEDLDLAEGAEFVNALQSKYARLTRLTTRMSAEDMSYDPVFKPDFRMAATGALSLRSQSKSLASCEADILDRVHYDEIMARQECATTYCGTGTCVVTELGAACDCNAGSTAKQFTDLDGQLSVTCVPDVAPVDLAAGGLELPDVCAGINCSLGSCLAVGGFPTCQCEDDAAASLFNAKYPTCRPILAYSTGTGARDYTAPLADIPVCSPAPPSCGQYGWLVDRTDSEDTGLQCASSIPNAADLVAKGSPSCADLGYASGSRGCGGCSAQPGGRGAGLLSLSGLLMALALARRRRRYRN